MSSIPANWQSQEDSPFDFIIVGAGAGGAPLAARLVERGFTVLVVEMGAGRKPQATAPFVENTEVPLLHPETTEDPDYSLRYFVKHFDHDPDESQDPKIHKPPLDPSSDEPPEDPARPHADDDHGIFYPRAQGIGGCTIHNAMITITGPPEDWDEIAETTGDESWRGDRMRAYFERLERCQYDRPTLWSRIKGWLGFCTGWEHARHGHDGSRAHDYEIEG